jgi:hypothetical protein
MWEAGQKTKHIYFWLADEDVVDFSKALHNMMPALQWQCSHGGADPPVHHFATLDEALQCGREAAVFSQAFASMPLGILQFYYSRPRQRRKITDNYAPDYVYPATINMVDYGRMAIRWNMQDGDEAVLSSLDAQLKMIWSTLTRSTLPAKVQTTSGRALSGPKSWRIGPHMLQKARDESLFLKSNGPYCLLSPQSG